MFIKYQIKSGVTDDAANVQPIFQDLAGIFSGNITSVAGFNSNVCQQASSTWIGSLDSAYFTDSTEAITGDGHNTLVVGKYHSDWSTGLSDENRPRVDFQLRYEPLGTENVDTAMRFAERGSNTNATFNCIGNNGTVDSVGGSAKPTYAGVGNEPSIYIWATKQWLCMQWIGIASGANRSMIFAGMFDYPTNGYAVSAFNQISSFYPGIAHQQSASSYYNYGSSPSVLRTHMTNTRPGDGKFLTNTGSTYNTGSYNMSAANGYLTSTRVSTSNQLTLLPPPGLSIRGAPVSSGVGHQLVPVYAMETQYGSTSAFYLVPRLQGLYRTTDNFSASGTLVTYDGVQYAAWAGTNTNADTAGVASGGVIGTGYDLADRTQVYLIPTTLDGY